MIKEFKSIAYMAVFVMIVGTSFYILDFYESAFFTLLTGLLLLAIYHAGLYSRGIIVNNTIANQKDIIERDKKLMDAVYGHIGFLEDHIKELKGKGREVKNKKSMQ